ncbi:MAG TPA: hypothetical protein VIH99_13280 [Bdellovibrionota bacterium]|jgi:hypothetical protein
MRTFFLLFLALPAHAADFDLGVGYAQSRDFWETVHDVQDRTGNISEIQEVMQDRYGRPDVAYSYLDAAYAYPHDWFDSETFSHAWIGTRAEALAGGEVSNPIFPEIQAYANSTGIASYGVRSRADALAHGRSFWSFRLLGGLGPEKRLYAKGPELIEAIPVRSGTLWLAGGEVSFLDQSEFGDDFWVTSNALVRPVYFHSSVEPAPSFPDEERSFWVWRWKMQNEWLKQTETPLSSRTRFGILSVVGQTPVPFTSIPVTWDYQQKTQLFPGLGATGGLGGILRLLSDRALPNFALYAGLFGGGIGGGFDLQLGPVILNGSTYSLENSLTASHDRTRLWQATLGVSL